jgi:DNA mismatch endonuclease (patch repair protein)
VIILYRLYMPPYFLGTFTEYPYSNNVDLKLAGLRVIRIWECEIKTKAKRNTALEALYLDIISKTTEYSKQDTNANIAAEPIGPL